MSDRLPFGLKASIPGLGVLLGVVFAGCSADSGSGGPEDIPQRAYAGEQLPASFIRAMEEVGAKDPEENIDLFFAEDPTVPFSSFCFVSDRKVASYITGVPRLTKVAFEEIEDVHLRRYEGDPRFLRTTPPYCAFEPDGLPRSWITLDLANREPVTFQVDPDLDRLFVEAIQSRIRP